MFPLLLKDGLGYAYVGLTILVGTLQFPGRKQYSTLQWAFLLVRQGLFSKNFW